MSAVAAMPAAARPSDCSPERAGREDPVRVAEALAAVGAATIGPEGVVDVLRSAVAHCCELLSIRRGGVYLREPEQETFIGVAGHPRQEIDSAVCHLRLGGTNDEITQEILRTRQPVVIRNAVGDIRASRAAIRAWKVRSLLAVPMEHGEEIVGLMIFDNGDELHPYSPSDIAVAGAFAATAAAAVARERCSERLRAALETATRQNKLLRRTMTAEHRLSDAILSGGGIASIVGLVAQMTGKPTALYDAGGHTVASAGVDDAPVTLMEDASGHSDVAGLLQGAVVGSSTTVGPLLAAGVTRRHLVTPIDIRDDRWGWLVLMEHTSRMNAFDDFLLRRAATHLALELTGSRRVNASAADARAGLARQLIRGTSADDEVRRTAEYLGIDLDSPRVVVFLRSRDAAGTETADADPMTDELGRLLRTDVLDTKGPEGVALLVGVSAREPGPAAVRRVKAALAEVIDHVNGAGDLIAGISTVCRDTARLPSAYREAREVTTCIETFLGASQQLLAADDLGPARLFLANASATAVSRFVEDMIGALLVEDEGVAELLRTLDAFYETGRSVRLSAERLGVHENTVRYRLSRVTQITGLDVAGDADHQLSVQVALLVLRLQGHPSLRSFEAHRAPEPQPVA
jgi:sugar diacid utilization regulator